MIITAQRPGWALQRLAADLVAPLDRLVDNVDVLVLLETPGVQAAKQLKHPAAL